MTIQQLLFVGYLALLTGVADAKRPSLQKQLESVYAHHPHTFLSQCPYFDHQSIAVKLCPTCPFISQSIVWMPIIPLSRLAQHKLCYLEKICLDNKGKTYKGIRCCKNDPVFKKMFNDLHNYVPELQAMMRARRNYEFDLSANETHVSGVLKIDSQRQRCSVDPKLFGFIARTYLYMNREYGLALSSEEFVAFRRLSLKYPADAWELEREGLIASLTSPHLASPSDPLQRG